MALNKITYYSELMKMIMGVEVIIPENKWGYSLADRPKDYKYPVLWLMPGGGYNYTDWARYTALELYSAQEGIAVVLPSSYYAGYMDTAHGNYPYLSVIAQEMPEFLYHLFPLSREREDNFVAGFSMGGYGAFKLAMQFPERYTACGVFSGPIGLVPRQPVHRSMDELGIREHSDDPIPDAQRTLAAAFGGAENRRNTKDDNLYMLEKHLQAGDELPAFYIATGQEDAIAGDNYETAELLHKMGLQFEDIRDHGKHNWEYCDRHVKQFIEWIPLKNVYKMEEA